MPLAQSARAAMLACLLGAATCACWMPHAATAAATANATTNATTNATINTTANAAQASVPGAARAVPVTDPTPPEHRRAPERTFLAFPSWYLASVPDDYARFIATRSPADFPYLPAVGQFWSGYRAVAGAVPDGMPTHAGDHLKVAFAGAWTTIEYVLKAAYETTIGRLAESTRTHGLTEEDRFGVSVAKGYADSIRVSPWYDFDFAERLRALWRDTSTTGPDMIRKWERKLVLSLEYGTKAGCGWLARMAIRTAGHDVPRGDTALVLDRAPASMRAALPALPDPRGVTRLADGRVFMLVPRKDDFRDYALGLAIAGSNFSEIAGNRADVLVSVIAPQAWHPATAETRVLLEQPVLTEPSTKRVTLLAAVPALGATLRALARDRVTLEHLSDY